MDRTSLIKGHLEMCVLSILSKNKSYGYEIMKELEEHNLKLKGVGSIYPILTKLKDQEWVSTNREMTENGKVRVYYEINEKGKMHLQKKINEWLELQQDIKSLLQSGLKGDHLE
ncbi:PadR family transcriptional regulator [Heyndrickxia oleronia]|jgi:DNA-binding PadR family transcriptional regulator|uniref:PadR family transcriptional regulator n=1 Tax=Heyndrickxia oleronia TaxID=38875 RepID=A0A8E2I6B1_9BACI|nr:PadR family transcriptional regulator [Heyndrickxia oleronia]OJH19702.1 PadR family transcriptional regulator [Bacillus obstructivus]MCI1591762.1 PadR family transcriptional regulator [Heyndrickxia oleronia]MCI1614962.1 PadR family transcriptional regulator [Heyndrickxia oleronia]MCI1745829.1 PadR family transcriptional regulator [Heyndrickxia oleronia]MCI1764135.1 PadR family transcriptional regulator [Heyndrickxia oleronia]